MFQFPTDAAPVSLETIPTILHMFIVFELAIVAGERLGEVKLLPGMDAKTTDKSKFKG